MGFIVCENERVVHVRCVFGWFLVTLLKRMNGGALGMFRDHEKGLEQNWNEWNEGWTLSDCLLPV